MAKGMSKQVARSALTGAVEVPRNAGWLLGKILGPPAGQAREAGHNVRDGAQKVTETVVDRLPGDADSVDVRLKRARHAMDQAAQAEKQALGKAAAARQLAEEAAETKAEGRARLKEARQEAKAEVSGRVAAARREADEWVASVREKAEQETSATVDDLAERLADDEARATQRAQEAEEEAQAEVDEAQEMMAEARRLADAAVEAAQAAADEASARARQMARDAESEASAARSRLDEVQATRQQVSTQAAGLIRESQASPVTEDLNEHTKAELVEYAQSLGIEGRSAMSKGQLITAIKREAKKQEGQS